MMKTMTVAVAMVLVAATVQGQTLAKDGTRVENWTFHQDVDEMTGKASPDIRVASEDTKGALMFWCDTEGDLYVGFMWGKYFAKNGGITVAYRFSGSDKVIGREWPTSTHQGASLSASNQHFAEFVGLVRSNDSVLMRVMDTDYETITARFPLTGAAQALQLLPCSVTETRAKK